MEWSGAATLTQAVRARGGEVASMDARGARLVTAGGCGALRLWRWQAGAGWALAGEARAAHRYGATAVRWAAGGALLASGGVDGAARVWGGGLAARARLAAPGAAAVRALCWAGARLAAGHDDGAVRVWTVRGVLLARLTAHEGALYALAAPAQAALLLTACTDGVLKVFDLAAVCRAGEGGAPAPLVWVDGAHDLGALCADAAEDGAAATGGHDAKIRIWRPSKDGPVLTDGGTLDGHTAAVTSLRWGAGGVLASASLDRSARLWAPAAGACLLVVQAHPRYLTCVVLAPDLRYMITGSNDKSFRMWSLGSFSLDDELEPPCEALAHFGLGDLEGIGPVEEDVDIDEVGGVVKGGDEDTGDGEGEGGCGAACVWREQAHAGAINCIATYDDMLATASSDGLVKVWRWTESRTVDDGAGSALEVIHILEGHRYPALAVDFGAAGEVLLTAGLDGCAFVWDVKTGVVLRSLVVPGGGGARGGEAGGGGVRGARVSPHRAPLLLLATDDGLAPLWRLTDPDPHPMHVYAGHTEAVTCCAWSADGRVAATGASSGELRLMAPPGPRLLYHHSHAHDLGVQSCDFAPPSSTIVLPEGSYLLATAGCDSLVKFWKIDFAEESSEAEVSLVRAVAAHGGAVAGIRWGVLPSRGEARLATAGDDRWARVWRVAEDGGGTRVAPAAAVPVAAAGGALAATLASRGSLLAVGSLAGELALWRLAEDATALDEDEDDDVPRFWSEAGVLRWLRDYIIRAPGASVPAGEAAALEERVRAAGLTGARLLDDPIDDLLQLFTSGDKTISAEEDEGQTKESAVQSRVRDELLWLRAPPPPACVEAAAPHALLCPLSHRVLREPARAADGYSYERCNLREWLCAEGAVSPISGRRLRSARVAPNYALRDTLRAFLRDTTSSLDAPTED